MAIQSDQEFAPTQIARAVFPTAFRGYDQDAVRRYLSRLASALEHQQEYAGLGELEARTPAHERVDELETELEELRDEIKDLELELVQRSVDGSSSSSAVDAAETEAQKKESVAFDEHRAIELLGQETARVLESARSAAADILKRAETQAASLKAQAKSELAEARRRAESIVVDTRSESEAKAAQMADEAQDAADKMRSEAEEHRTTVLEESSKILTEAEELAEVEQAGSEERAKQIVADAETLRQQVISEVVNERRQAQVEMDRMTSARDRLAMSLAVARSELDEVADALVDVSTISVGPDAADDGDGVRPVDTIRSHAEEVDSLINTLAETGIDGGGGDGSDDDARSADNSSTSGTQKKNGKPASKKSAVKKKRAKRRRSTTQKGEPAAADAEGKTAQSKSADPAGRKKSTTAKRDPKEQEAGPVKTGSALFEDAPPETSDGDAVAADTDADTDADSSTEAATADAASVAGSSSDQDDTLELENPDTSDVETGTRTESDAPEVSTTTKSPTGKDKTNDKGTKGHAEAPTAASDGTTEEAATDSDDEVEVLDVSLFDAGEAVSEMNEPPAEGQELSLVEGFTTIELNEIDLRDGQGKDDSGSNNDEGGTGTESDGSDRELVRSAVANEGPGPEEMITTVTSRTASAQRDRTRGDLLIDEPYTGRLGKEFAARDVSLTRSGPNFRRQLRRALNDDQSDVLDRLRAGRGEIKVDELPTFGDQIDRYLTPLRRGLAEIAQAGAKAGGQNDLSQTALDNLVRQLAKYIVDKVRIPTIQVVEQTEDQDRERILEPVRALYRDFRNVGLSELTEDALYEAFAIGLYDSIEPSAPISWVIDPRSDPDPVCEINSQRDDVVKGVVFPSGHARPLSLPGCRCLVKVARH